MPHHEDANERDYVGEQIAELLDHAKAQRQRADDWNTPEDMEDGLRDTARVMEDAADMLAAIRGGTFGAPRSPTPIDPSDEQVERAWDALRNEAAKRPCKTTDAIDMEVGCCLPCRARAEITALRSPVPRELREALEPFAEIGANVAASTPSNTRMTQVWSCSTAADFRRAKRAYDHLIQKEPSQ